MPSIRSREELNVLMRRMLGRVSISHLGVGGGDVPTSLNENENIGLLGADLEISDGLYRIKRVLRPGPFDVLYPRLRAPLVQPGDEVHEGEYLFAIDDEPLDADQNIHLAMRDKARLPVQLVVGPTPDRAAARTVRVIPLASEVELRLADQAERNRKRVEEKSNGLLGYFVVPQYGMPGVQDFFRGYFASRAKPGMIIDQRYNGGGITPDYFAELLARKPTYSYMFRDGDDLPVPVNGRSDSATVLLINEENGSAAETFALMFQLAKLGPIVGSTTYGGVIGPYAPRPVPPLIDGGRVSIPTRAAFTLDGRWVENDGVHPDIPVEILPQHWLAGQDPQLDAAIAAGLDAIHTQATATSLRPDYPRHPE
jgi:tricorn protease